jgi:hypothetical protein
MEGLAGPPVAVNSLLFDHGQAGSRAGRIGQRWLSFLFLVVVGLAAMIYLAATALP